MLVIYQKLLPALFLGLGVALFLPDSVQAQLVLEREFVGGATSYSEIGTGLQVDATFGQPLIGFAEGDLIVTVGFHQGAKGDGSPGGAVPPAEPELTARVPVSAYPNPTVERLVVDLNEHRDAFREIRLVNAQGQVVRSTRTQGTPQVIFSSLEELPNANYFLQGVDGEGDLHQLGTVMIITK